MSFITHPAFTHAVTLIVGAGLGYWFGKKGTANVVGDVKVAVQDISKKV